MSTDPDHINNTVSVKEGSNNSINETKFNGDDNSTEISSNVSRNSDKLSICSSSDSVFSMDISCDRNNYSKVLKLRSNEDSIQSCRSNANIGAISVENSSDVTFGNKTFFNGPVVIKNVTLNKNNLKKHSFEYEEATDNNEKFCKKYKLIVIFLILSTIIVVATAAPLIVQYLKRPALPDKPSETDGEEIPEENGDYEFVTRSRYGALPRKKEPNPLEDIPVRRVLIGHTVTEICSHFAKCADVVLKIQFDHMYNRNYDDIGLNFLVGGDGRAYEGRGYYEGSHTQALHSNFNSICISFIGEFTVYVAPQQQLIAAQRLIEDGIKSKKIHPQYTLYGQGQMNNSTSPGGALFSQIMLWPRWSSDIIPL